MKTFTAHSGVEDGSVARFRANSFECLRGLWKSLAVASIMDAMNGMRWTDTE